MIILLRLYPLFIFVKYIYAFLYDSLYFIKKKIKKKKSLNTRGYARKTLATPVST